MHGNREDIPLRFQAGSSYSRDVAWGDMNVAFEAFPRGADTTPLFKGLPDDRCQCPHWGYIFKGKMRVTYADREEVISAGEAFYIAPGHNVVVEEDCEVIEFSPKDEFQETVKIMAQNIAAMRRGR